jgi:hypothetical protein
VDAFENQIALRSARFDISYLRYLTDILKDRESLKTRSKEYEGALLSLELEATTLGCLEVECKENSSLGLGEVDDSLRQMEQEDRDDLLRLVEEQRVRVKAARKKLEKHQFSSIADIANELMIDDSGYGRSLNRTLASMSELSQRKLQGEDLSKFAKSAIIVKRKLRKLAKANPDIDPEDLLLQAEKAKEIEDTSWDDMLAMTRVLLSYGCIVSDHVWDPDDDFKEIEDKTFEVTPAGLDVGMLNFENALWCFTAMGGTFDVVESSSQYDELNAAMLDIFEDDYNLFDDDDEKGGSHDTVDSESDNDSSTQSQSKARQEAEELVAHLRCLSPSEIAGYVSSFATGDSSRNSLSSMEIFRRLSPRQQRAIQLLLGSTDRFKDVQRQFSIDERTCGCQFEVSNCEVITAWADGCTWSEALEMSGAAPGDLTRIIGRAMDAVRQLGNLKYYPLRKDDLDGTAVVDPLTRGIHPELRKLCREAARAMNRYPVKDPLPFAAEEGELLEDTANEDLDDDEAIQDAVSGEADDDSEDTSETAE